MDLFESLLSSPEKIIGLVFICFLLFINKRKQIKLLRSVESQVESRENAYNRDY